MSHHHWHGGLRYLHDCSDCFRLERVAGWGLHPLESAALSRRTPITDSCTAADTILIRSPLRPRRAAFRYTQRRRLASLRIGRMFSRQHRSLSMAKGTVKWFNPTKGYGFIQPASGGGKDVFVHISAVEKAGLSTLNEGQTVEYEEVPNKGKTSAENLKVV